MVAAGAEENRRRFVSKPDADQRGAGAPRRWNNRHNYQKHSCPEKDTMSEATPHPVLRTTFSPKEKDVIP